ncbi:hypothetical protein DCAR_0727419 [Daucus carota subsp. sativus]|uniref:Uncharacterized protein n=1 Tax=Daucus carota subsp. sativus TaxID=79200 RepID=A0A164SWT0_DAUCS|nr:hypothetical protein DCAR_0727419 [Daucus carota subsp. sativus]
MGLPQYTPLKRKRNSYGIDEPTLLPFLKPDDLFPSFFADPKRDLTTEGPARSSKAKENLYQGYSFNCNGLLSKDAVKVLDEGLVSKISDVFKQNKVNLDAQADLEMFARDVLHQVVNGTLDAFMNKSKVLGEDLLPKKFVLIDVEEVLTAMGLVF